MGGRTAVADGASASPSCGEQGQRKMDDVTVLCVLYVALKEKLRPSPNRLDVGRQRSNRSVEGCAHDRAMKHMTR